ncbi:MarR family transcriptional regulator [Nocardioides silvaticus]|uniref:MarR family transcriptional regulator n=2 Tax=Nocardioides silvaticus TaxID=2201891 RepID=A0A316TY90_9ACTN|nr:MarR family transcriptional regulator [Nocardioides silvaticus]
MTYANDMPTTENVVRTDAGLASELRLSVMRLRRRLAGERHPDNLLSMGQLAILGALYRNGDQTVGELAAMERVQPPSMTRTVNCLADGGYVERRSHPSDGRQVVVTLTEEGRAVLLADRARRDEWLARQLAGLTAEERAVLRKATPILQRLAQAD